MFELREEGAVLKTTQLKLTLATGPCDDVPLLRDVLGGGVTSAVTPHEIVYQLDGDDICVIGLRDQQLDILGANDLDGIATLRFVRGLMFAAERLMQMEYARRQQSPTGPQVIDFEKDIVL